MRNSPPINEVLARSSATFVPPPLPRSERCSLAPVDHTGKSNAPETNSRSAPTLTIRQLPRQVAVAPVDDSQPQDAIVGVPSHARRTP